MRAIDSDALMALIETQRERAKTALEGDLEAMRATDGLFLAIEALILTEPTVQPEQQWIPVKFRPMDSEEREYWEEQFGEELADEDAVMFDCQMPKDGQEILVSYRKWINMDKCEIDGGCYGLEGNGDWEDVVAWMSLPEPYEEEV